MNVTCPQCASVFRVDPAKVPERGVRARCSVCGGLIAVRRPAMAAPAVPFETGADPVRLAHPHVEPAREPVVEPPPPPQPQPISVPPVEPEPAPPPLPPREPVGPPDAPPEPPPIPPMPMHQAPPAEPVSSRGPARFTNPFLQQDPSARARRLARALISDLVVYHPDKRQRGLAEGNLKELFAEEIRKSWEEYAEQVGEDVANTTPYFTDALNDILAEGRKVFG